MTKKKVEVKTEAQEQKTEQTAKEKQTVQKKQDQQAVQEASSTEEAADQIGADIESLHEEDFRLKRQEPQVDG